MLTSVEVAPGIAALRILNKIGLTSLPGYVGACGRLAFTYGGLLKLSKHLDREWDQRIELARQVLRLIENLLAVEGWLLVAFGLNMDSFSVTRTGQVVLFNLDTSYDGDSERTARKRMWICSFIFRYDVC